MVTTFKTSDTNITNQYFMRRVFLSILYSQWAYRQFSQKASIPRNNGKVVKWRYHDALSPATTELTEGTTPTGSTPTLNEISATVGQYGDFIQLSDAVGIFDEHGNLLVQPESIQNVQLLGGQAVDTLDVLARDVLVAGTNVFYAGAPGVAARTSVGAANKVSEDDFAAIVRSLQNNKVKPIAPIVTAGVGVGTVPIDSSYFSIVSPYTLFDLKKLDGFVGKHKYGATTQLVPNEVGALADIGVRFLLDQNAKVFSAGGEGGIDVHGTIVFGQEAFGEVNLEGDPIAQDENAVQIIPKPFDTGDKSDPLNQRATLGWKIPAYVMKILRQNAMYRYEHAITS